MAEARNPFRAPENELHFPREEEDILAFWKRERIFERSLEETRQSPLGTFVFYEGPPTANGTPHNGHVLTRVMKDIFPRYKTMRGYHVPRKAGWDTHGLPVEVEVEKELRIHGKAAIEAYGIEPFTERCIESVFRYTTDWERLTERIAFWCDLKAAYVTYHRSYVESVWWALAELYKKGLLYRGHKVVWWWAQGGTALSSAEVGLGYKTVDDPSAFVSFPLLDPLPGVPEDVQQGAQLVVWTTTPWTLPSNMFAAVSKAAAYTLVEHEGRRYVVAEALAQDLATKIKGKVVAGVSVRGEALSGLRYVPPFAYFRDGREAARSASGEALYWRVVAEDFVTLDTGTGIVHVAPAFGEDDHRALRRLEQRLGASIDLLTCVRPDGTFGPEAGAYAGRWVKDCDRDIAHELKERGLLVRLDQYRHDYPFCWRADSDPLLQMARPAWYIRTTSQIGRAIENNRAINWLPDHIKEGRFGDFLANNVDWALSRERYWGTPLPIWENPSLPDDHPERFVAIDSLADLRKQRASNLEQVERDVAAAIGDPDRAHHLLVHKPWIDRVTFEREGVPGTYRRVPEVIDCWFDSGCMPFAQWGFPHAEGSLDRLREAFPADFISEAIDQTRGWFYTLLMVSTLVFDEAAQQRYGLRAGANLPHPYKTCIVLGHVCDREGKKESKSKGNYTPPDVILDRVRMEFGVVSLDDIKGANARKGAHLIDEALLGKLSPKQGEAHIALEDLEGLDLTPGAKVALYRSDREGERLTVTLHPLKGMKRRVVLLHDADAGALGVARNHKGYDVMPVEVTKDLEAGERVTIEDTTTPAPGADAFRWFFYASSPPWSGTRHSLTGVRTAQKDLQIKVRNCASFFAIYANIDAWHPGLSAPPPAERPLLCRWMLSELALATRSITESLDRYAVYEAAQTLTQLAESLSNWYVRRSRERFWAPGAGEEMGADKRAAYATLYTCLTTIAKLAAPFVPYFAESLHRDLSVARLPGARESVHLERWPSVDEAAIDALLSQEMAVVRDLVSLGLQVRNQAKLKVRQPLRHADVVLSRPELEARVRPYLALVADELNVHEVRLLRSGEEGSEVRYRLKPNFKVLGPKVGKKVQAVKKALEQADASKVHREMVTAGSVKLEVEGDAFSLGPDDVEVAVEASPGFAAAGGRAGVVVLHATLDDELLDEGLARELQSKLQQKRRDLKLAFTDRVDVVVLAEGRAARAIGNNEARLRDNVLIERLEVKAPADPTPQGFEPLTIEGESVAVCITRHA